MIRIMTYPVAVLVNGEIRCIQHIEKDDLFRTELAYIGTDINYSGYELYADMNTGKLYAADAW